MRRFSLIHAATVTLLMCAGSMQAQNVVITWNNATLSAIKATNSPPTVVSRALAMVHTSMFDAWATYDTKAVGTLPASPSRQPASAATPENKARAVSYAAYTTLVDLFPTQVTALNSVMTSLSYDPAVKVTDSTPAGIGNSAAAALLAYRRKDGSNQQGDLGGTGAYADYTGYTAVNFPDNLTDPFHWQPVRAADGTVQRFLSPHWGRVTPFALKSPSQFRPGPPGWAGTWLHDQRLRDEIRITAELDDRGKMSAEFWDDGAGSVTPPGHWNELIQDISIRDKHTLDDDVKMFFAVNNAEMDAAIAVWDTKRTYDAIRPQSAIRYWYQGVKIPGWGPPGRTLQMIDGANWIPWIPTAPHAEYPSGHSAFSSAAAEIMKKFTGSDTYVKTLTFKQGSSRYDPNNSPATDISITWNTYSEVADDAGFSRRLGGIHFEEADFRSRTIGRQVANVVWEKYLQLIGAQ